MDVLVQLKPQASATIGTATDYSRGDHEHAVLPDYRYAFLMMGG
jgi:hypothetical protein